MSSKRLTLAELRDRLAQSGGRAYWRSLEELAGSREFEELLHHEFPRHAAHWNDAPDRRQFLRLMAASLALAGVSGCAPPPRTDTIMPYVRQPEQIVPGTPLFFATTMPHHDTSLGLLVESHEGRPTKIEGNPEHPASLGATDAFAQAEVLSLYDPDRAQTITHLGQISTWEALVQAIRDAVQGHRQREGEGLYFLSEPSTSPTLARQHRQLLEAMPQARWHQYRPVNRDNERAGAQLAFGRDVQPVYHFEQADIVLSLDADFLARAPASVRSARHFMSRRQVRGEQPQMNRLYVVESTPTNTGAVADHRLPLRASDIERFARALAGRLGALPGEAQDAASNQPMTGRGSHFVPARHQELIEAIVEDLQGHRGRGLVLAGRNQPPAVHALVHAVNDALGNAGQTVDYIEPVVIDPVDQVQSLRELADALANDQVQTLVILGANPVYDAPADLDFAERLRQARLAVQISMHEDETSRLCHWHVPQAHFLETWGDARTFDGTASIIQPLIAPLYAGRSVHEVLSAVIDQAVRSPQDIVSETWREILGEENFERTWQQSVHDGVVAESAFQPLNVSLQLDPQTLPSPNEAAPEVGDAADAEDLELTFQPDPTVWDGRYANNGWLQELPKPLTKLTWDNAALISPSTAQRLGLANEEVVQLTAGQRSVRAPVWIVPGQPDDSVTVYLGYGRMRTGRVGRRQGFDAYRLRTTDRFWYRRGLRIERTGETYRLATTQHHALMEGRDIVRSASLASFVEDPGVLTHHLPHHEGEIPTLYSAFEYPGYAWGMSIDLTTCSGCNACVVACQAENNVPIVGKDGVLAGREMHWLRIDRYYEGEADNPRVYHQPMLCVHCETAPCEVVCPVAATTHSHEGINEMTYNRCVGTRYCSNNCPYKVRRFNFLEYNAASPEVYQLQRNPNVTVRSRGVIEKCTYCVQRINRTRIETEIAELREGQQRRIQDGDVVTACQAACPSQSIVFGDINDPQSRVSQHKRQPQDYGVLAELGTKPRTTYLAHFRNPHPRLEANGDVPHA